ncbi:MAG: polyribonucleotide nucleotidyltransferase, partial [Planctomycetes bacterium]|nr:polyribonucleotide nucleotidyltransferase [Planctomycetota bacterium]
MSFTVVEREIAGRQFRFESGKVARQAAGACWLRQEDNIVLAAAVSAAPRPGLDFFPLTVDYREKRAAAGKFPGGFKKREGPPTVKETLVMRLIDRPVRPLWPEGFIEDIQVQALALSSDRVHDCDVLAINAASAALHLSDLPFQGPFGAVRVGRVEGKWLINPSTTELETSDINLVVAGTREAIIMVEAGASEVPEADMLAALEHGHGVIKTLCEMQDELRAGNGAPKREWRKAEKADPHAALKATILGKYADDIRRLLLTKGKHERSAAVKARRDEIIARQVPDPEAEGAAEATLAIKGAWQDLKDATMRRMIMDGERVDGRRMDEVRPIEIEIDVLPRAHGSCLFTRGETQALVTITLGTTDDEQMVDGVLEEYKERFMLHYSFPPFSVNEVKPIRGPGRREIGHGMLAQRALEAVFPSQEEFPYTVRVNSDITESNGSSSMASICAGCMGMMAAGVPVKTPVAGVAMGLVMENGRHQILTDILGDEDHYGDMDFKVGGSRTGITALQMDIKVGGLTTQILADALEQARKARIHVLDQMARVLDKPRAELSPHAPRVEQCWIDPEKIGLLIGPGGSHIRALQEETGCQVEVDDDGHVFIYAPTGPQAKAGLDRVKLIGMKPELGAIYTAKVTSVKDFGCFVELAPGTEALCHVSELAEEYVDRVEDIVSRGDTVRVKVILVDETGRIKVSRRAVLREEREKGGHGPAGGGGEGGRQPGARPIDAGRDPRGGPPPEGNGHGPDAEEPVYDEGAPQGDEAAGEGEYPEGEGAPGEFAPEEAPAEEGAVSYGAQRGAGDRGPAGPGGYGGGGGERGPRGYGGDRGGPGGDRPGYGGDRSGPGGDRPGYGGDRGGPRGDRPGYGGDRGGYGGSRGGGGRGYGDRGPDRGGPGGPGGGGPGGDPRRRRGGRGRGGR